MQNIIQSATTPAGISVIIFVVVFIIIITEKIHRAVVAVAGALLLILMGVLDLESAVSYIDYNTIGVLVGMMLFVAVIRQSGVFEFIAIKSAKIVKGNPWKLMVVFMVITAVLSAFLDNVTTVLLVGPMVFSITQVLKLNPIPYFIALILSSNIGGTATLIGDPPNIMIGSQANLSFLDFIINDAPISIVVLVATIAALFFIYGRKLAVTPDAMKQVMELDENDAVKDRKLMNKSVVMIGLVIVGFILHSVIHVEPFFIALVAAVIMMIIGGQNAEKTIEDVEWPSIIFFIGLFIVVGGMVETGVIKSLADLLIESTNGNMMLAVLAVLWGSAILSAILDNIPFVATMIPLIIAMGDSGMDTMPLWWALSLGACLGGNGTLIGASANVVLSGISGRYGYPITFRAYLKIGVPMMLLSMVICTVYMLIRYV